MKKLCHSFILLLACVVAAFAAPAVRPGLEKFALNYLPKSVAVFTQLSAELEETKALQESLREDLVLFDVPPEYFPEYFFALSYKIRIHRLKLDNWNRFLKENYLSFCGGMITPEQLAEKDSTWAEEAIAWKNSTLKNALAKWVLFFPSGIMVSIPGKNYLIGECEVTQAQYQAVMGENPSYHKGDNLPVECVSWNDAIEFCKKLTQIERIAGRLPAGMKYTLPTSAQWEYACRAGTTTDYNTGDGEAALDCAGWYFRNSGIYKTADTPWVAPGVKYETHPVGQKEPNAWGLYDMHGNVWEWCLDEAGLGLGRVYRGGSCSRSAEYCRSSIGRVDSRDNRYNDLGFRLALVSQ